MDAESAGVPFASRAPYVSTAGTPALEPASTAQQAHGVSANNGNIIMAGRDVIYQSQSQRIPEGVSVNILEVLRLVPNLRRIHLDMLSKATRGTRLWFFKTRNYLLWIDPNGTLRIFWGTGIPGAGKTVMASIVINDLEARAAEAGGSICVAYVYFRYSDTAAPTVRSVLEILVKQTVERHADCALIAEQLYARHLRERTQPTESELLELLGRFVASKAITFYVLDALDEAPEKIQVAIIKKLATLDVRLFITSRPLQDVEDRFPSACGFSITAQDGDLDLHIRQEIAQSRSLQGLLNNAEPSFEDDLISSIKSKCSGMFLHASLQLEAISYCTNLQDVMDTLQEFPSDIDTVYRQAWQRIGQNSARNVLLAKSILMWVLAAARSMTIEELRHAVATSSSSHKFERKRLVPAGTLISLCCGLVTVEEETKLVRLVHYTAKDTLEELLRDDFPSLDFLPAVVCMTHLVECGFQDTTITAAEEYTTALQNDPLLAYASHAWVAHVRNSVDVPQIKDRAADFISKCKAYPCYTSPKQSHGFDILGPMHVVALYHLSSELLDWRSMGDANTVTKIFRVSPLQLAAWLGNEKMVRELLQLPDIQVNYLDKDGTTTLMLAAEEGHGSIVNLLLERPEIEVNLSDTFSRTALVSSAANGHENVVLALLARQDIQVNLVNSSGRSALVEAVARGRQGTVELLLAHPDINLNPDHSDDVTYPEGWTLLMDAIHGGHEGIVRLLLGRPEIEVNVVNGYGYSPMMTAAARGYEGIVRLLLMRPEIQVNAVNNSGWSSLALAVINGHKGTVELLLTHRQIDVNLMNHTVDPGWTPLIKAALEGDEGVVKLLLEHPKIEVNRIDNYGQSAITKAAEKGHEGVVRLLLEHPATQVNLVDFFAGHTPLMIAASMGRVGILRLLLADPDILVNLVDDDGRSALMLAKAAGHEGCVAQLLAFPGIQIGVSDSLAGGQLQEMVEQTDEESVESSDIDVFSSGSSDVSEYHDVEEYEGSDHVDPSDSLVAPF